MRRIIHITLVGLMVGVGACGQPDSPPPQDPEALATPDPELTADAAMRRTAECVNLVEGYAVRHPEDWHVHTGDVLGRCALFDPEPIFVPIASEVPVDIAIIIGVQPVPFATLTGEVLGRRDLSRTATTIDARRAMRIDGETTGEGLHDAGIRSYEYFIDLGDSTLVAATYDVGALAFDSKRAVLDAMMATLTFGRPE